MPDRDFPASKLFSRFFSGHSKRNSESRDYPTSDPRQKQHPIISRDRRRQTLIKGRQNSLSKPRQPTAEEIAQWKKASQRMAPDGTRVD